MKDLEKKIKRIEEIIHDDDFEWGSSRLDRNSFTESEKKLLSYMIELEKQPLLEHFLNVDPCLLWKVSAVFFKRAVDLFMRVIDVHFDNDLDSIFFWHNFIDFLSETLLGINQHRGEVFKRRLMFGDDPESWPDDDDPAWNDFMAWCEKWERDFEKKWKEIFPIMTRVRRQVMKAKPKISMHECMQIENRRLYDAKSRRFFGETITGYLAFPHNIYFILRVLESHKNEKSTKKT